MLVQEAGTVSLNQRRYTVRSTVYYSLKLFQLVLHAGLTLQQIPLRGHCSPRESLLSLNCLRLSYLIELSLDHKTDIVDKFAGAVLVSRNPLSHESTYCLDRERFTW